MASAYFDAVEVTEPPLWQVFQFTLVFGLHGMLITWLAHTQVTSQLNPPSYEVFEVRMINPPSPEILKPVTNPPGSLPQTPQPVARPLEPITPPVVTATPITLPVLTTSPSVNQDNVSVTFVAPTQPPAPAQVVSPASPVDSAVTEVRFDADYLQNPTPVYPALSRRRHEEGKVLLLVRVTAKGEAEQVQVKLSSGFARLDEAALNTVRQWRFVPARQGEEPITASVVVPIIFHMDG
ncbi:MAG: energy transducer TonB [Candidatus Nitrotoga sp.]